jgi:hypothetical protein
MRQGAGVVRATALPSDESTEGLAARRSH